MAKVILICGKICSGKTFYTHKLMENRKAVLLSCDELMYEFFHRNEGEHFDEISRAAKGYLHRKAAEIVSAGADVILDWGFWTAAERHEVSEMYHAEGIPFEWHYTDITEEKWAANIAARNAAVEGGGCYDYPADEGLLKKLEGLFEVPAKEDMDVWYLNE